MSTRRRRCCARGLIVAAALIACDPQRGDAPPPVAQATPAADSIDAPTAAFLDTLQERTFGYFRELANPANGLVPDRWPTPSFSSIAAVGMGLTAWGVAVERGWATREEAAERVLTTLRFFWNAPQGEAAAGTSGHRGFFYHFLDMQTGARFEDVELSTIDTTLLLAGALFCREYFDGDDPAEAEIRALADSLYFRVDWPWAIVRPPVVSMGWRPERGFVDHDWRGYDESMLLYVLALASPTHPVEPAAWTTFTETYQWGEFHGHEHVGFAPMFGHQYSHIWIDFRGIRDAYMRERGIDYFENSRRATLAQREYAIANPNGWRDYGPDIWGLTASDGPIDGEFEVDGRTRRFFTYAARGASFTEIRDDGTIAPTAAGGSVPFAPEETIAALRAIRERYGEHLWGEYGFLDSFNPTFRLDVPLRHGRVVPDVGWFDGDYIGIDQGPIVLMIENHRTELIWRVMRRSPYIVEGLRRAGFTGGWLDAAGGG